MVITARINVGELRDMLSQHMQDKNLDWNEIGTRVGISSNTVRNFVTSKNKPNPITTKRIESYLEQYDQIGDEDWER
jgi:hypothetical protein